MTPPQTPAARELLERLRGDRDFWAAAADDDAQNAFLRHGATSRRDLLDALLIRLPRDLAAIEAQAREGLPLPIA